MSTLTITSDWFCKLFGLKQKIANDQGISLTYHTGMIFGSTSFFKEGRRWVTITDRGLLFLEEKNIGVLKNRCLPEGGTTVVATISAAGVSCKAVVAKHDADGITIHFLKEGRQIAVATSQGTHDDLRVSYSTADDLWIILVLGWCAYEYVFLKAWEDKRASATALPLPPPAEPRSAQVNRQG